MVSTTLLLTCHIFVILVCTTISSEAFRLPVVVGRHHGRSFARADDFLPGTRVRINSSSNNIHSFRKKALICVHAEKINSSSESKNLSARQERLIALWEQSFADLKNYLHSHDGELPRRRGDGQKLYSWLYTQRLRCRTRDPATGYDPLVLTEERIQLVTELVKQGRGGPRVWDERYNELKEFIDTHDGRLPLRSENPKLVDWVSRQVKHFNMSVEENKPSADSFQLKRLVTNERIDRLKNLVESSVNAKFGVWDRKFEQLEEFVHAHGRLPSQLERETLYGWLRHQLKGIRRAEDGGTNKSGVLTGERMERLLKLVGAFPGQRDQAWENRFSEVEEFVRIHGRLPTVRESASRSWLDRQLKKIRDGSRGRLLTEERTERLNRLVKGVDFGPRRKFVSWEERFSELETFARTHGRLPTKSERGGLGPWLCRQQKTMRQVQGRGRGSVLNEERIERLTKLIGAQNATIK